MQYISSTQNALVKKVLQLQDKSRLRKKEGLFIVEGLRELELALKGGYNLDTVFFYKELISEEEIISVLPQNTNLISVSKDVHQKIAYRSSTEAIVAILKTKSNALSSVQFQTKTPLILIAEAPEKPGNIGAFLRTADAANVDAVIIANPKTDLYNPNIIRSSVGCLFTNTLATGSTTEIITFLKEKKINIFSAILQESEPYYTQDFTRNTAIIVGTESTGLSQEWRTTSYKNIHIPMQGEIDSMNVSVAAGILLFEVKRQRNFK